MTQELSKFLGDFPETKAQQASFVGYLKNAVLNGNINPLKAEAIICNLESVCKQYRADKEVKEALLNEARKYGEKSFDMYNANFQIKDVGVKYDYSVCGHPDYDTTCAEIDILTARKKDFENQLKAHSEKWVYTSLETGETCEVYPPVRIGAESVVVTIK